jgi:hypothetical protein
VSRQAQPPGIGVRAVREHPMFRDAYGPVRYALDLGSEHWLRWLVWGPDLRLNPQYAHLAHLIRTQPVVGALVVHACPGSAGGYHEGVVHFRTDLTDAWSDAARRNVAFWDVLAWEPLTLSPSLLLACACADHGHVREGRWARA